MAFRWAVAASLVVALAAPRTAHAERGILYGPEDARVFGDPKQNPGGVIGYCVPWSILASMHIGLTWVASRGGGDRARRGFDLTMGMRCGRSVSGNPSTAGLVIIPQVGYSMEDREPGPNAHLFRFGAGIGFGTSAATIAYAPRLLVGPVDGERAWGIRQGMLLYLGADLITLEVSHQMLFGTGPGTPHDIRLGGSVNLLVLAYALAH